MGSSGNGADGGPGIIEALEKMISRLRQECIAKFADKDDITSLRQRVSDLEKDTNDLFDKNKYYGISLSQCRDITDQNRLDIEDLKKMLKDLKKKLNKKPDEIMQTNPSALEIKPSPSALSIQ